MDHLAQILVLDMVSLPFLSHVCLGYVVKGAEPNGFVSIFVLVFAPLSIDEVGPERQRISCITYDGLITPTIPVLLCGD